MTNNAKKKRRKQYIEYNIGYLIALLLDVPVTLFIAFNTINSFLK